MKAKILTKLKKIPYDYKSIQWIDSVEPKILTTTDLKKKKKILFNSMNRFNEWVDSMKGSVETQLSPRLQMIKFDLIPIQFNEQIQWLV